MLYNRKVSLEKFLLKKLGIDYTYFFLNKLRCDIPTMDDSLTAISNILSLYKVELVCAFVENKCDFLNTIDSLFVAETYQGNVCVVKSEAGKVVFYNGKVLSAIDVNEFVDKWTGLTLLVEKTQESKEPNYKQNLLKHRLNQLINIGCVFSLAFLCIALCLSFVNRNINNIISLLINSVGVGVCLLLVSKQLDMNNRLAQKVCTAFSKQDGCKNLLDTSAAKIGGVISWSEIGLGFFLTNLILLFVPSLFSYVLLLNCLALPFSFWSIGYQKFVAKQWCVLCLCSQAVLWLFCISNLNHLCLYSGYYTWDRIGVVIIVYIFIILFVNRLVQFITKQKELKYMYERRSRQSLDDRVFNIFLHQETYYKIDDNISSILFGNRNAKNVITIVTNPFCSHCAELHKDISEFDVLHTSDFCIQYVFNSYSSGKQIIDKLLVSLYFNEGPDKCSKIYEEWFLEGYRDPGKFMQRYTFESNENPEVENECRRHWEWFDENKIIKTPLILVNGYKLPLSYTFKDLLFIDL